PEANRRSFNVLISCSSTET
nr:hypothetical protein [Tanacetum cinerariifolium]